MKRTAILLFCNILSIAAFCEISFFDWDYPDNIEDPQWNIIYEMIPEDKLFLCLYVRDSDNSLEQLKQFKKACDTKGFYGAPGRYTLPADDPTAILIESLAKMSGINDVVSYIRDQYKIEIDGYTIHKLLSWYGSARKNLNLDTFSLYLVAEIYISEVFSPFNFFNIAAHYNHPMNDLSPEDEKFLRGLSWLSVLDEKNPKNREKVDSILAKHPQNVLIKRYIKLAKVAKFAQMYRDKMLSKSGVTIPVTW